MAVKTWASTANTDYSQAANWSPSGVPIAADDVVIPPGTASIQAGLNQSAVALASFTILSGYTGLIGQVDAPLQIRSTIAVIGARDDGRPKQQSGRIFLDFGSGGACQIAVLAAASSGEDDALELPPVRLNGVHASHSLDIYSGRVGVGARGEAVTMGNLRVMTPQGRAPSRLEVGGGATISSIRNERSHCIQRCSTNAVQVVGGEHHFAPSPVTGGVDAGGVAVSDGGRFVHDDGDITALIIYAGGFVDCLQSPVPRTIASCTIHPGGRIALDPALVTLTAEIEPASRSVISVAHA
jgi:hypothetical protein